MLNQYETLCSSRYTYIPSNILCANRCNKSHLPNVNIVVEIIISNSSNSHIVTGSYALMQFTNFININPFDSIKVYL